MSTSIPAASIQLVAFACPHCGAHSTQTWHDVHYDTRPRDNPIPNVWTRQAVDNLLIESKAKSQAEKLAIESARRWHEKMLTAEPFIERHGSTKYSDGTLHNVFVSECFACHKLALWLHDKLLYPPTMTGPAPNLDLPEDALRDYEEARTILDLSPRGAAALLRLAVEKLCDFLEAKGDSINDQIAWLMANKNLNPVVQQALDTMRVIGNEAVHPGQIDLRDDRETATKLFGLLNIIADEMITRPKNVRALYDIIPPEKRQGIEARNAKAIAKKAQD